MKYTILVALALSQSYLWAQKGKPAAAKKAKAEVPAAAPEEPKAPAPSIPVTKPVEFSGKVIYAAGILRQSTLRYDFEYFATPLSSVRIPVQIERKATEGGLAVGYSLFGMLAGPVYWGLDQTLQYYVIMSSTAASKVKSTGAATEIGNLSQSTGAYSINPIFGYRVNENLGIFAGGGLGMFYQQEASKGGATLDPSLNSLFVTVYGTVGLHWLYGNLMVSPQFRYDHLLGAFYMGPTSSTNYSTAGNISRLLSAEAMYEFRLAIGYNFGR